MDKYIAMYLRLSQDDDGYGESNSITSQRQIIEAYIRTASEFSSLPVKEFIDDGYSGTNFERPGVKQLLEAVRHGRVNCVIVKDFSRFGRQYLEVSKFIEQVFPYLGVRFIAVNDHYDSNNHKGTTADIDVPVRNMINAMYSKDISKKVKSSKRAQVQNGVFSNAFAPFGYKKDETDKHRLLIDEPAAEIVRRIFALAIEKHSAFQIAEKLNADGVITPSLYKKNNGSNLALNHSISTFWTNRMVSKILRDERYTGMFIGCMRETVQIGSDKSHLLPEEEWVKIPNVLPAIIEPELYHSIVSSRKKSATYTKPNTSRALYKKVQCGYCGRVMQYIGNTTKPYYLCNTARYTKQHGCKHDRIHEQQIIDTVKTVVQSQVEVMLDMEKLCRSKRKGLTWGNESAQAAATRIDNEVTQLQTLKRQFYERYKSGSIDKTTFMSERETIERDINTKTTERNALLAKNDEHSEALDSANMFFSSFLKYQQVIELTNEMLNELVLAVYVFKSDRIEVQFSFGGELEKIVKALDGKITLPFTVGNP